MKHLTCHLSHGLRSHLYTCRDVVVFRVRMSRYGHFSIVTMRGGRHYLPMVTISDLANVITLSDTIFLVFEKPETDFRFWDAFSACFFPAFCVFFCVCH